MFNHIRLAKFETPTIKIGQQQQQQQQHDTCQQGNEIL